MVDFTSLRDVLGLNKFFLGGAAMWAIWIGFISGSESLQQCSTILTFEICGIVLGVLSSLFDFVIEIIKDCNYLKAPAADEANYKNHLIYWAPGEQKIKAINKDCCPAFFLHGETVVRLVGNVFLFTLFVFVTDYKWAHVSSVNHNKTTYPCTAFKTDASWKVVCGFAAVLSVIRCFWWFSWFEDDRETIVTLYSIPKYIGSYLTDKEFVDTCSTISLKKRSTVTITKALCLAEIKKRFPNIQPMNDWDENAIVQQYTNGPEANPPEASAAKIDSWTSVTWREKVTHAPPPPPQQQQQ